MNLLVVFPDQLDSSTSSRLYRLKFSLNSTWWIHKHSRKCKRTVHLHLKISVYTLRDLLLSGTTSPSFCHPPLSRLLSGHKSISLFILLADSCAWLSGSLFMRPLHLSPAAPSVTPLSSRPLVFLPFLPLSKWNQIKRCGFSSANRFPVAFHSFIFEAITILCSRSLLHWRTVSVAVIEPGTSQLVLIVSELHTCSRISLRMTTAMCINTLHKFHP